MIPIRHFIRVVRQLIKNIKKVKWCVEAGAKRRIKHFFTIQIKQTESLESKGRGGKISR